ncbi:MAG TPA: tetratricopeptide repeat protein [Kofleriaceae bacterium]|nr:tetratricopeptide repeat protein [Kofleriaceae bacterium]
MRRASAWALAAALSWAVPSGAGAQPAAGPDQPGDQAGGGQTSAPDGKAIARAHFKKAKELHDAGRYAEAAVEYLEAYRHFPAPEFLYNAGQVYRLAGDRERAIEHYRRYLDLEPEGAGADNAREFIAELEAAIAAERRTAERKTKETGADQGSGAGAGADAGAGAGADAGAGAGADAGADAGAGAGAGAIDGGAREPGRGLIVAGATIAGAGVVALGAAALFGASARSASDDLSGFRGRWTAEEHDRWESGQAAERNMIISLAAGGAALATGGVLLYLGRRKAREGGEAPVVGAWADGRGASLTLSGRF